MEKVVIILLLALAFVGCGSQENKENRYEGRAGQERYCEDNGWIYQPETNDCRIKRGER